MGFFSSDARFVADMNGYSRLNDLLEAAKEEITILSPYVAPADGHVRKLAEKSRAGVRVTVVFRRDKGAEYRSERWFAELAAANVQLLTIDRLHSKLYMTEREVLLTSMNFLSTSGDNSYEAGVIIEQGHDIYDASAEYIDNLIEQYAKPAAGDMRPSFVRKPRAKKATKVDHGYCIRCATEIPLNPGRPLCAADYKKWAEYKNKSYPEKFCLSCGQPNKTSVQEPVCAACQ